MIRPMLRHPAAPVLVGVAALALLLRLVAASGHSSMPEADEIGYLSDGLLLLEGLAPGYKHTPNALINWLVFAYSGVQTVLGLLGPVGDPSAPVLMRPMYAMEKALFVDYADLGGLRDMVVVLQVLAGAAAAVAVAGRGWAIARLPGAVLGGALAAATPLFVEYVAQTRAYSFAWSFAMAAYAASTLLAKPRREPVAGVLMGLAIATRVEMGLALIPLLLEAAQRSEPGQRIRAAATVALAAIVTFLVAAPWYITSLAGNLRQIVSVRLLVPAAGSHATGDAAFALLSAGIALPLAGCLAALLPAPAGRGRPFAIASGILLALLTFLALRPSLGGMRHDGALLLLVAVMSPVALARLQALRLAGRLPQLATAVAGLLALHLAVAGAREAWTFRSDAVPGDAVAWLEQHVPSGETVFWPYGFRTPLPTPENADALWAEVATLEATRIKYRRISQRLSLEARLPRAMDEDSMQLDRSIRRGWFILGAPVDTSRPRYFLRPSGGTAGVGTPFATPFPEIVEELCAQGGTVVYYGEPIPRLGKPTVIWEPPSGKKLAVVIYAFPHIAAGSAKRC